jgi:dTDP-4-amino-4,6-dideoxygalactose transaminase
MVNIPLGKPFLKTDVVLDSLKEVLDSKWISGGPTINKFEDAVRDYNNDDGYYVAVSNALK